MKKHQNDLILPIVINLIALKHNINPRAFAGCKSTIYNTHSERQRPFGTSIWNVHLEHAFGTRIRSIRVHSERDQDHSSCNHHMKLSKLTKTACLGTAKMQTALHMIITSDFSFSVVLFSKPSLGSITKRECLSSRWNNEISDQQRPTLQEPKH